MRRSGDEVSASCAGETSREVLAFLSDPRHYPGHPRRLGVVETHFAWVFLAGAHAYKLKKPTRQSWMDYRTLASRERGCRSELRLNRRLAPRVYLRVIALRRARDGRLALGRGGATVDWLVKMRRLARHRMLDHAVASGSVRGVDLDRVAAHLVRFFRRAARRPLTDRAYLARERAQIMANARELAARDLGLAPESVQAVCAAQLAFLAGERGALARRGARVRDGHGDLRPEHVFLGTAEEETCIIDCLEFNADLRRLDPAEEMAFLALECRRLGADHVASGLIERYRRALADPVSDAIVEFYMSRRALTRAQIAAWHLRDPDFATERREWLKRTYSYLDDALRHIRAALRASRRSTLSRPAARRGRSASAGAPARRSGVDARDPLAPPRRRASARSAGVRHAAAREMPVRP